MKHRYQANVFLGFASGLVFPLIATLLSCLVKGDAVTLETAIQLQVHEPLMWIIDTAPIFLAVMAWYSGVQAQKAHSVKDDTFQEQYLSVLHTLDALPVGVFAVNASGSPIYANEKAVEILGKGLDPNINQEELAEKYQAYIAGTKELYPTENLPVSLALKGQQVYLTDIEIDRNGSRILLEVLGSPIKNKEGKVVSAVSVFQDITQRHAAEVELQRSRAFLESLIENLPAMLFVKDAEELRFVRINRFGEELLGVRSEDMKGKNDYDFFPSEQADFFVKKDLEVLHSTDGPIEIKEEPIETAAHGKRILRTRKVAIKNIHGQPEYLLGISEDITELKMVEELNQRYLDDLQRANRNLDQFAYVISHDLKTPLRGISSLTDWIVEDMQGDLPEGVANHIRMLKERAVKLESLINGVLEYSRSGRRKGGVEEVRPEELVREIAEIGGVKPPFQVEIVGNLPILQTDKLLLSQVLGNLIMNSVNHHPDPAGWVGVSAEVKGDWVEFSVRDNGKGIPEEVKSRIFQLFYKLPGLQKGENSGLGLAIVKKIVEDHGGQIRVISEPGKGADFRFTWPLVMTDSHSG